VTTIDQLRALLADRYAIERPIGEGGMATVYLARDLRHNRRVALKVVRADLGAVLGAERFLAEIEVTANLQHPNLLPLFDSGIAGESLFYVMPFVAGESLRARLEREKQLPIEEAVRIATAIAGALDYAHRQGVIHRDLKPENVLLHERQPLVADFGIALAVSKAGGTRVTQTGLSLGTPQYMSPEQATGDRELDARSDVYSLGALTYEMLTGEPPHTGATAQAIIARLLTERPRPARATRPAVPVHVEATLERALEKLPADRFESAQDFAEALSGARAIAPARAGALLDGGRALRRRPATRELVAWSAAAVLAVTSAALLWRGTSRRDATAAPSPVEFDVPLPTDFSLGGASAHTIAIAPDGRTVVFTAEIRSRGRMLFVRRLGDRAVTPIRGSEDGFSPVISPDGAEVAFARTLDATTTIYRLPIGGGTPRALLRRAANNGQVAWNADGRVLFAAGDSLWLQTSDAATPQAIVGPGKGPIVRYGFPHWLPDQTHVLITVWRGAIALDSARIAVLSLADGSVTELDVRGTAPRYSKTGHLLFADQTGSLMAAPFDVSRRALIGAPVRVQEGIRVGSGGAAAFAVADDGTLAIVNGNDLSVNAIASLVAIDRAGTMRNLGVPSGAFRSPRVSPDGRQVVFVGTPTPQGTASTGDVWRAELSPPRLYRVTTSGTGARPFFGRDGRSIYFTDAPAGADSVFYRVALDAGAKPQRAFGWGQPFGQGDLGPPNTYGVFTVFPRTTSSADLWVAPSDSLDRPVAFAAEPFIENFPRVAPDGRTVAYVSLRTGASEIYLRTLPGGGDEVGVSRSGGVDVAWARSGRELFYRDRDSMYVASVTTAPRLSVGAPRALFALPQGMIRSANWYSFDVMPGDRELVFFVSPITESAARSIIVRLNWAAGLPSAATRPGGGSRQP
jgi:serine/threonine-protein kinase